MVQLPKTLEFNRQFVASRAYEPYVTDRIPQKRLVVLTCMDTRLTELLPRAMNLRNGDAKIIKNAGAIVSHAFGSVMRSILVAVYALKAREILVVGHHDCGMTGMKPEKILEEARSAGVPEETLRTLRHAGIDLDGWLTGFASPQEGVRASVAIIRNHPLLPAQVAVEGLLMDPGTGRLERV